MDKGRFFGGLAVMLGLIVIGLMLPARSRPPARMPGGKYAAVVSGLQKLSTIQSAEKQYFC